MKRRLISLILTVCMLTAVLPVTVHAADHPIRMTAEPDPDCVLSGPGTLSYVRFVIKNTGDDDYTLYNPTLSSDVLDECSLYFEHDGGEGEAAEEVTLEPGTVREFRIFDLYLPESALNTDILFTLKWQEAVCEEADEPEEPWDEDTEDPDEPEEEEEPEDPEEDEEEPWDEDTEEPDEGLEPVPEIDSLFSVPANSFIRQKKKVSYITRKISTTIFIETAELESDMTISVKTDSTLVRTDGTVKVKYVLTNRSKFDFEDIRLTDTAAGGRIELEETDLRAGESMTVMHTFTMGREDAVLCPEASYTVRGKTCRSRCEEPLTVEYMFDSLTLDVQQYATTEEGTTFALTVTNAGTHRMKEIVLEDDAGTRLCTEFSLNPGQSRSLTYTYGSYTGLQENRRVSFLLRATDSEGEEYFYQKPGSFEIRPYVGTGQVSLAMNVTMSDYFEETNTVQMLFEIRNYSDVAISNAFITESAVLGTRIKEYPALTKGVTTFTMDFSLGEGISVLTFHMEADDAGGTHYATEEVTLHVDQLALTVKNGTFGASQNTIIDTSGTVFDTDKYRSYITTGLLVLVLTAFVFILISAMFRGAEKYIRKIMPEPESVSRVTNGSGAQQDTARLRFGYMKPAKLRYAETDTAETQLRERRTSPNAAVYASDARASSRSSSAQRRIADTGNFIKPARQVHMLTTDDTRVFEAPVLPRAKAAFITDYAKKKETPPQSGVRTTQRIPVPAKPVKSEPEPALTVEALPETMIEVTAVPEEKAPLTMAECLAEGRPYTFETEPLPAVIPARKEPEIIVIG